MQKTSVFIFVLLILGCSDEHKLAKTYKGCCDTEAVEANFEGNLVYIPNIFTPNGDGLDDIFKPFFDFKTTALEKMVISSKSGTLITMVDEARTAQPFWGWFGSVAQDVKYEGVFSYEMTFRDRKSAKKKTITGTACSAICNEKGTKIDLNKPNQCLFPMQYEDGAISRQSVLPFEIDCLNP